MEFTIKKDSQVPILKMSLVNDGRTDSYQKFQDLLVNSKINFSMEDMSNGVNVINKSSAYITDKIKVNEDSPSEYIIYYPWKPSDTKRNGRYIGEFEIITEEGELIAPIREKLYINIV